MAGYRCIGCRSYFPRPEFRRVGLGSVCSERCLKESQQPKRPPTPRPPDVPIETRAAVRERDRGRCRFCGTRTDLHSHHIAYRSEGVDHSVSNLITLCARHHALVHSDKGRWQPVCQTYIAEANQGRWRFLIDLDVEINGRT